MSKKHGWILNAWEKPRGKSQAAAKRRRRMVNGIFAATLVAHVDDEDNAGLSEVYHAEKVLSNGNFYFIKKLVLSCINFYFPLLPTI